MEANRLKEATSPTRRRGSAPWKALIAILILVLAAGWMVMRQMHRPAPRENDAVLRLKVPAVPPPAPPAFLDRAGEDAAPAGDENMLPGSPAVEDLTESHASGEMSGSRASMGEKAFEQAVEAPVRPVAGDPVSSDGPPAAPAPVASDSATAGAPPAPPRTDGSAAMTIQVAAFLSQANAVAQKDTLSNKGYAAYIHEYTDARQRTWHTVRIGRFASRDEAVHMLDRFNREESAAAIVVRAH
jgi:cell division septation protein DedD